MQTRNLTPGSNRSTLRFRNQFTRWTSSFNDRTILEQSHRVFETSFLQKSLVHTCANIEHRAKNWMNVEQHCSVQSREIQTMDPVRSSVQLRLIPEPREEPRESTNTADGDGAVDFPPNRTRFESKGRLGYSPAGIWPNWLRDRCATMGGGERPRECTYEQWNRIHKSTLISSARYSPIYVPFTRFPPLHLSARKRRFAEFYVNSKRFEASSLRNSKRSTGRDISDSVSLLWVWVWCSLHARFRRTILFQYFFRFSFLFLWMKGVSKNDRTIERQRNTTERNF